MVVLQSTFSENIIIMRKIEVKLLVRSATQNLGKFTLYVFNKGLNIVVVKQCDQQFSLPS